MLASLRKARKFLFSSTNLHFPITDMIMKVTIGDDWKDRFDLILCDSRKPLFQRTESPFYTADWKS